MTRLKPSSCRWAHSLNPGISINYSYTETHNLCLGDQISVCLWKEFWILISYIRKEENFRHWTRLGWSSTFGVKGFGANMIFRQTTSRLPSFSIIMGTFSLTHTLCSLMMDPDVAGSDHSSTRKAKPLSLCLLLSFQVGLSFLLNTAAQSEKRKQFPGLLFLYSLTSGFLLEAVCVYTLFCYDIYIKAWLFAS